MIYNINNKRYILFLDQHILYDILYAIKWGIFVFDPILLAWICGFDKLQCPLFGNGNGE